MTWDAGKLLPLLASVHVKRGHLLGRMATLGFELRSQANLTVVTSDVVKSAAIEGESLNPAEVRSSVARRLGLETAGLPRAGRAVDGIVEMMLDATQNFDAELTKERLFGWHALLFPTGRSGMEKIAVGAWRPTGPMQVVSGPYGRERVHFEAPEATRLEPEMIQFIRWFNATEETDAILKAGVAHFWFVTIHPFEDGNGRIARAIADLALARADRAKERFYSMSAQIEAERNEYYRSLETSQKGGLDITAWLLWFLGCLDRSLDVADQTLAEVFFAAEIWQRFNRLPPNDRQRRVIARLLDDFKGFLTTSKYAKMAKCSSDTALRDIRALVENGILVQNPAKGRSTSYRLAGKRSD